MELYKKQYYDSLNNIQGIMLSATPLYSKLHEDHDYDMDVLIQVTSGKLPNTYPRKDIDICIVLDRSGSMASCMDSCKESIKVIIESLHETDTIHLVAYDDHVENIFSNCNVKDHKILMLNKLHSLKERGSTNLFDGVKAGLDMLINSSTNTSNTINTVNTNNIKEAVHSTSSSYLNKFLKYVSLPDYEKQETKEPKETKEAKEAKEANETNEVNNNKTKILFLFSDGMANAGIVDSDQIGKMIDDKCSNYNGEIYISTFGIGDHYDEVLMGSIAYCGKGNYFYIQKPENIPSIIEKGLNGLTMYWTRNAKLSIAHDDSIVITDKSDLIQSFKVREYALHRYLIKAKCSEKTAKITFTLNFINYDNIEITKEVTCSWEYVDDFNIVLVPNKNVRCYKIINECSELNKQIMNLMDVQTHDNENKIKELKNKIIELYTGVLIDDEYGIIGMLLKKEKETLQIMNKAGTYSMGATKQQGCNSMMSTGHTSKMCKYVSTSSAVKNNSMESTGKMKTDGDLGYTSFM